MRPSETKDLYTRLGINSGASEEEIKNAYKRMALKYHPDKNPNNREEATREFIAVSEAFEVLSDPVKRAQYDSTKRFESKIGTIDDNELLKYFSEILEIDFEVGTKILPDGTVVKKKIVKTSYGQAIQISATKRDVFFYHMNSGNEKEVEDNSKKSKKGGLERLVDNLF